MRMLQIPSAGWGLILFTAQYLAGIIIFPIVRPWESIVSPFELIAVTIVIAAANSFVIVEGAKMLAESFLKAREKLGREQGREQALKEATRAFDEYVESLKAQGIEPPSRPSLFDKTSET